MRIRIAVLIAALGGALAFSSYLPAQSAPASAGAKVQKTGLMPDGMPDRRYYHPTPRGLEQRIGEALERMRHPKTDEGKS